MNLQNTFFGDSYDLWRWKSSNDGELQRRSCDAYLVENIEHIRLVIAPAKTEHLVRPISLEQGKTGNNVATLIVCGLHSMPIHNEHVKKKNQ